MSATMELAEPNAIDDLRLPPKESAGGRGSSWLQTIKSRCLTSTATTLGLLCGMRGEPAFGILMFHRVTDEIPGLPSPTWNVTPQRFEEQLTGLLRRGFVAWPLRKVLEYHHAGLSVPRNVFVVTFDDGYQNVFRNAFPVLRKLKIPATVFLATAYLDSPQPFPCDDWSAKGQAEAPAHAWQPLSTDECRTMLASGLIELAAHTHTHQDFRNRPADLHDDLLICLSELRERFGLTDATFAFPYGTKRLGFAGPPLNEVPREMGLLCSLSTESELIRPGTDPFDWGRFNCESYDTAASLAAKLQGWYEMVRRIRPGSPHRRSAARGTP